MNQYLSFTLYKQREQEDEKKKKKIFINVSGEKKDEHRKGERGYTYWATRRVFGKTSTFD